MVFWPAARQQSCVPIWLKRLQGRTALHAQNLPDEIGGSNEPLFQAITDAVVEWTDPHVYADRKSSEWWARDLARVLAGVLEPEEIPF
jgi:hypothetical protein